MVEIEKLLKRMDKMEEDMKKQASIPDAPVIQYTSQLEDTPMLEQLKRKLSTLTDHMNDRMQDVNENLSMLLESNWEVMSSTSTNNNER